MALSTFLARIAGWLRAGYPDGVPPHDYIPLVALLRRQLSDEEIALITEELSSFSPAPESAGELKKAVTALAHTAVSDTDLARVRARLALGGWPLAKPERD
jgi:uncharacterized protein (DUF2267 family)